MAARARAAARGGRDGRGVPAPRRVSGLRDRRGRARDRAPGARVARAAAADDGAGRQRDLRGDVPGGGRRHPPLPDSRRLVGYLGLDPRVHQSGSAPAKGGRISKQGSAAARWALVEAAWSVVQQPGPLRAFYQRIRARRGRQDRRRRRRAQARGAVLVPAHARRGLRPPAALADGQEAPPARDPRRRAGAQGQALRRVGHARRRCARPRSSSPRRPRPPTSGRFATGKAATPKKDVGASVTAERA